MKKRGRGYCKPPNGFLPLFFRKAYRLEPTGGPNPFRPVSTMGPGPAPCFRGSQDPPTLSACVFLQHGLAVCQVGDESVPQSYQGLCARGVCDDLIAQLSLPAPLAPLACCQGSQASHHRRSVGVPSAVPVTDPCPPDPGTPRSGQTRSAGH